MTPERQPRHMLLSLDAGCVCEMCEMRRENQRLRDALERYGQHDGGAFNARGCPQRLGTSDQPCTCGLAEALTDEK